MEGRKMKPEEFSADMITPKPTEQLEEVTLGALFSHTGQLLHMKLAEVDPEYFSGKLRAILEKVLSVYDDKTVTLDPMSFVGKMDGKELALFSGLQSLGNASAYDDNYICLQRIVSENRMKERALNILRHPDHASDEIEAMQRIAEGKTTYLKYLNDRQSIRLKPAAEPLYMLGGAGLCYKRHITVVKAQSKAGKSTFTYWLVGMALGGRSSNISVTSSSSKVLIFDTEQDDADIARAFDAVEAYGGNLDLLQSVSLGEVESVEDRVRMVSEAISQLRPTLAVIDNVKDLCEDYMDAAKSEKTVRRLMTTSKRYNCAILGIIHENPGTDKARGHLGSLLYEKAHDIVALQRMDDTVTVSSYRSRSKPFETFCFGWDSRGFAEIKDGNIKQELRERDELASVFRNAYGLYYSYPLRRCDLIKKLEEALDISAVTAGRKIKSAVEHGILSNDEQGYKLNPSLWPEDDLPT